MASLPLPPTSCSLFTPHPTAHVWSPGSLIDLHHSRSPHLMCNPLPTPMVTPMPTTPRSSAPDLMVRSSPPVHGDTCPPLPPLRGAPGSGAAQFADGAGTWPTPGRRLMECRTCAVLKPQGLYGGLGLEFTNRHWSCGKYATGFCMTDLLVPPCSRLTHSVGVGDVDVAERTLLALLVQSPN